jgi:hypothetical protein
MPGTRKMLFAAVATAALVCLPVRPVAAAGPFLFAPWALGHIVLPLVAAATAASQPATPYGPSPAYAPGFYAPPNYYVRPPGYYGPSPGYYPPAYYRPALSYGAAAPPSYAAPRGYYPSRPSYYGPYGGGRGYSRAGSYSHRRW